MKKNIFKSLFMSVLCILAVSCEDTDDFVNTLEIDSNKTQIMFSIGMDSPIARSRATWGEDYNPSDGGDAYDNRINPDQLYVKITYGGQTYDVKKILKWQDKNNISSHTFIGEVEIDLKAGESKTMEDARIEVYANWNPDAATNAGVFNQDAEYIPMWGVQTADITLAKGKRETLDTIYLLRAMAKLQVNLTDEMFNEYALTEVKLNKHNAAGYCMPTLPEDGVKNTKELGLEDVLNAKADATPSALTLPVVVEGRNYVVYLPEVENGTTEEDWLKITVQLTEKKDGKLTGNTEEGSFYVKDYTDPDAPVEIDIVRNHWYKYEIKGFAASEILLNYAVLDWNEIGIEIGGDGFLFLNKDVIEIYNSNIDADQLKFSSSSPIKRIELKDSYKHYRNGEIKETPVGETADEVYAYYMDKFGVLTQLSSEEGTDEAVVLANISAEIKEENKEVLNGGIVINSPFMANAEAVETVLKNDSHYNTVRYLEFEVENEQGLKATFRVMQYPPVVVTNEEGYFSYRDDHKYSNDQEEASHYHNFQGWKSYHLSGLMWYKTWDWTDVPYDDDEESICLDNTIERDYSAAVKLNVPEGCEVVHYGNIGTPHSFIDSRGVVVQYTYGGLYRSTVAPADASFVRHRYLNTEQTTGVYKEQKLNGKIVGGYKLNSSTYSFHPRGDYQGLAFGPIYEAEIDGKIRKLRKQYVWNVNPIFYNLYVGTVYQNDGAKQKGQADIYSMQHNPTTYKGDMDGTWGAWGKQSYTNHRMYNVKTTVSTSEYTIGNIDLLDKDGKPTKDAVIGVTANSARNANIISPSFMVASQLGETRYQSILTEAAKYPEHVVPNIGTFYKFAVDHCREYVETTYKDENNNFQWDEGESITYYRDWRLPTKAEIDKIIELQKTSRAMDKLLVGEYYFCATGAGEDANPNVKENWISNRVDGFTSTMTGYYIRCVRDVKPGEKK